MLTTVKLPSGAELKISSAPFADAKALYQAVLAEAKSIRVEFATEVDMNLLKDIACLALSSKTIEDAVNVCMKRALYNGKNVSQDTFEPEEAREDYIPAVIEVTRVNITPFMKSLYAQLRALPALIQRFPA
jgi:hypothetical protein